MATSSYANLFGTTGAGRQGSKAGISTMFGQQATVRQDDEEQRRRQQQQQAGQAPTQTFAQMQASGQARPAPQPQAIQQPQAQPPMLRQLQQQLQPMGAAPTRPGEMAVRGQAAPAPAPTLDPIMAAQRAQLAMRRQAQPQPQPGAEPAGMLTAEQAGQPGQIMYSRQGGPEMGVSAPAGGMQMEYSRAGGAPAPTAPQTAEQQQQMLAQAQQTATPETRALMAQASQMGMDPNAVLMNPAGFRQQLAQQGVTPATAPTTPTAPAAPTPTAQGYEGMLAQLQQRLGQAFEQPSGYTTPEFQQLRQAQMGELQAEFGAQRQALEEDLARRGLAASSIGAGRMGDLAGQQARAMAGLQAQLLQQQAEMGQRGRESALGTLAQVTGQLGQRGLGEQEVGLRAQQLQQEAAQFGMTLSEQQAERMQRLGISTQELGLRAQQLQQEARLQGRELDIREAQNLAQNEIEGRRIEAQQSQFGEQMRLSRDELALRGDLGRGEQQLAERRLQQEGRLEEARQGIQLKELGQRQSQFEASLGAEEQRFVRTLEEQRAGRLQQLGISTRQLDNDAARIQQEAKFQNTTLTLQEARDKAEVEYRAQSLAQQLAMQGIQIGADEARQRAQIDFQREQMASDEALRREGFTVDRERITQAQRQFDASFGFQQGQAQQSLAMELARIFSASDNPQAAATIMPILQEMLKGLPGYQASMTPPPAGTPAPTPAPAPAQTSAPAPAPTANPYNNPLGPISGTNQAVTSIPDFSEILRMGAQGYNPYDQYAGYGGTL